MTKKVYKKAFGWGFLLWLIGYILGIVLFKLVSPDMLGWVIMPIGIIITVWVVVKKFKDLQFADYVTIGIVWTIIAIMCDYLFLVLVFKPTDGYYKLDVYLYYILTLVLPILVGMSKKAEKISPPGAGSGGQGL